MPDTIPLERRVVITGLGMVACCGIGKEAFWRAVRDGISGISRIDSFDVSDLSCKVGGQVRGFDPLDYIEPKEARKQGRFVHFAIAAAKLAVQDAELDLKQIDRRQFGVAFGNSSGGNGSIADEDYRVFWEEGLRAVDASAINEVPAHAATGHIAIALGLKGPGLSDATACATALINLGRGFDVLRSGAAKGMLVGGTEAVLSRFIFGLLCRQRVLTKTNDDPARACRPFDKTRDGLVLGEGAGALMLETADHALARGAHIYAEMIGYGIANEAHHMFISLTDGRDAAQALKGAMSMARIAPTDVDYICAHGIGTRQYDVADTKAIKLALGDRAYNVPVSSIKAVTSQPFAAAGALQAAACCMAIDTQTLPPTINYSVPDEECDLDYVPNTARQARVDTVLLNAHGFGGAHAAVALRRFEE